MKIVGQLYDILFPSQDNICIFSKVLKSLPYEHVLIFSKSIVKLRRSLNSFRKEQ